jgi:zinc protease
MRRFSILFLFILCFIVPSFAQTAQKKTLSNGLTILVQENHTAPVVAVRFYVKTGSIYEGKYLGTGISHLFEHVLQEGSKTRSKEEINAETQALGGQTNAYTSNDVTAYHIVTAVPYFERALNNLADSMMNATFPESEVKTQQGIIHHEMNMGEDDPGRVLWKTFYETAFITHPVRLPVIGYRAAFDALTRDDIVSYYETHYTPDNTILAVAGDVKAADVFAAAEKALGSWKRRAATTPVIPNEPTQNTPRRAIVEKTTTQNATAMMGWHTVPIQHPDLYALDVLAQVLGGGETSRLTQELREKQELVYGASAFSHTPNYDAGVFAVRATLPPEKLDGLEKAVWAEINKIKTNGVTAAELARVKRGIETSFLFEADVADQAERMAYDFMGTGNPDFSDQYVARINAVTAAQVQAVAKKYLLENGVTTVAVRPVQNASTTVAAEKERDAVAPPQMFTLKNGLRLIVRENKTSPTAAIVAVGLDGLRMEPANKHGVANITADLLLRGTTKRSALEFSQIVDDLGGSISTGSGYNAWTLSSNWLARDWRRGLSLVHEALTQPAFSEDELRREKTLVAAAIRQQEADPDNVASQLIRETFFGQHPYGRSTLGTAESIAKITRADVVAHWKRTLNPSQTVLAVYGAVDAEQVRKVVEYLFGGLATMPQNATDLAPLLPLTKQTDVSKQLPDIAQTVLYFGYPGIKITGEDRAALTVLDGALSGIYYPGGRLHARLRDNQLVYGVHAFEMRGIDGGSFMIMAATTKDKRDEVRGIIEEEVRKIREAPISEEELARAKGMAITANAVDLQTNQAQAGKAANDEIFGLGYRNGDNYEQVINAVTREDVQRVAQKYLRPEASALAIVEAKE